MEAWPLHNLAFISELTGMLADFGKDGLQFFLKTGGFVLICVAAYHVAKGVVKVRLPIITGFLFTGIAAGPFIFRMFQNTASTELNFVNEFSLAFIAYAAGSELYLKELRSQFRSLIWNTFGQLVVTFAIGVAAVVLAADFIPFMQNLSPGGRLAVGLMAGTIFVARSPSSAIAVINEMRAKGPFTQTALGVTVIKDVLVIILFAICFSLADTLVTGHDFEPIILGYIALELVLSFAIGFLLGKGLQVLFAIGGAQGLKAVVILISGYSVYLLSHMVHSVTKDALGHGIHVEPLLICIIASFFITNYTDYRAELHKILEETGPYIYVAFFTLTGISLSLDVLVKVWAVALFFFGVRMVGLILGSFIGGFLAKDPPLFRRLGWMPYVTQAGVGLGLATQVGKEFPTWGEAFVAIVVGVIVLNQLIGPPLFKWAISLTGEDHSRAPTPEFDGLRDVIIVGLESQSIALTKLLKANGWEARIMTRITGNKEADTETLEDVNVIRVKDFDLDALEEAEVRKADAVVLMLSDKENYRLAETIYENIGTQTVVARLTDYNNFAKFHELGVMIVEPSTAVVNLIDNFVRSPDATALLLGLDENKETVDLEVINPDLYGMAIRDIKLPSDTIILSVKRENSRIISHGYTRLRKGDRVTLVGSRESLDKVTLKFDG